MKRSVVVVLLSALWAMSAQAQDVFPNVQYISGRAGLQEKIKGTLVLTSSELRFNSSKGDSVFAIPLGIIKGVSNSVEHNPGSTGAKIMLGVFASKKEEFLYINTETASAAEAFIFKCKNKTSPAMVAKLQFEVKRMGAAAADTVHSQAPPSGRAEGDSTKKE